jgi:hypothetical protein
LGHSKPNSTLSDLDTILNFVDKTQGLRATIADSGRVQVCQEIDGKVFNFSSSDVTEVILRSDSDGKPFIQVNFRSSNKVLFTDTLIGFKPIETLGLDMSRIPKVVTTPDLMSVFEAIEEALSSDSVEHEVEILKKVYYSILSGAEKVGFDLSFEKAWIGRLIASKFRASA